MKFQNLRLGHATNSSSSHSMIIVDDGSKYHDDEVERGEFGWNFFTAASKEAKELYAATALYNSMSNKVGDRLTELVLKSLNLPMPHPDSYIDHQSEPAMPNDFDGNPSIEYVEEFLEFIRNDNLLILGGNDNEDFSHKYYDESREVKYLSELSDELIARKDGDYWTFYNRDNGNRFTFSFKLNPEEYKPKSPMLIDMKITDFCTHGCAYCYQGSTKNGEHGDYNDITRYFNAMGNNDVFEVAIGGGEPTSHPKFVEILESARRFNVVPNFTTKSLDWLRNDKIRDRIIHAVGAFAFSVDDIEDVTELAAIVNYHDISPTKVSIQVIPYATNVYKLENILREAHRNNIRVTLLGFKDSERGAKFKSIIVKQKSAYNSTSNEQLFDMLKKLSKDNSLGRICFDTTLAAECADLMKEANIPKWLYHVEEGKYSMYIDAVAKKYGPSSYHHGKLVSHPDYGYNLQEMFKSIEPV